MQWGNPGLSPPIQSFDPIVSQFHSERALNLSSMFSLRANAGSNHTISVSRAGVRRGLFLSSVGTGRSHCDARMEKAQPKIAKTYGWFESKNEKHNKFYLILTVIF